jgi:cell wall-associated NlpC family hydrolase
MSLKDLVEDDGNEDQESLNKKLASMEVEPEPVQQPQSPAPAQPAPALVEYATRTGQALQRTGQQLQRTGQQLQRTQSQLTKEKKLVATLKKQIPKKPTTPPAPTPPRQAPRREPATILRPSARIGAPGKGKTSMRNTYPGKSVSFGGNVPSSLPGRIGKKRRY